MKNIRQYLVLLCSLCVLPLWSQAPASDTDCNPTQGVAVTNGEVNFNYGSVTNAFSYTNRSSLTIGQPIVGRSLSNQNVTEYGFWTRFLLPPQAPFVMASQGDYPDRVQLMWNVDPLSSDAKDGFTIKRDGAFLAEVDADTRQFIDFNVQAGEFYEYEVIGKNQFGAGFPGPDVGFVNPNGVVTGKIETNSGNPVANAVVTLEPTIGKSLAFDGQGAHLCVSHQEALPTDMWTISAWVKIGATHDSDGIIDLGSDVNKNAWIKTTASADGKGVVVGVGDGTAAHEVSHEFENDADDWHQVTAVYSAGTLILYVDGMYISSMPSPIANEALLFTMGSDRAKTNFFDGNIDDVRIYNRPLSQTEIIQTKDITVSGQTAGLVAYWKMDEGLGRKVFDITNNEMHAYITSATFSNDAADVLNAGKTDAGGYYIIEGVNYSEEQTFYARPSKNFYNHYALEFNAAAQANALLTAFDIKDTATIELAVHPFDLTRRQTLLSNEGEFELFVEQETYKLTIAGQTQDLGPASTAYEYLSLTMNATTGEVAYYLNGNLVNTVSYAGFSGDWSTQAWQLAAKGGDANPTDFYTGLIDQVSFFDTTLTQAMIQLHASPTMAGGVNAGNPYLTAFFPIDEGEGTVIEDYGPNMTGAGNVSEASFSIITYRQKATAHDFRPSERIVNLNPSVTAVGGVDFVDESTVTISGVVRFSNTFCYQDSVELLVNGAPYFPPIYTDSTGRFVGDFEPGADVVLTPRYPDTTHQFLPGFYQVNNLNRPIAGVLFQNTTKRDVYGQIAGGDCRMSINYPDAPVRVKIASLNGCYEKELTVEALNGRYHFKNVPPTPMAVSITYHPVSDIYDYFQVQGGSEIDLRRIEADTVDFIYIAAPQVQIEPFQANLACGEDAKFIQQSTPKNGYREYSNDVRVYEEYKDQRCYLDSFNLIVDNDIADASQYAVVSDTSTYELKFYAGIPNLGGDYTKFLQVTAEVNGATTTAIERVVVLGERSRESTFTTASPAMPVIILRDPPGDGSSATLSEGTTSCVNWSNAELGSVQDNVGLNIDLGTKVITYAGTPFGGVIMENENAAELDFTASIKASTTVENAAEFCVTNDVEYSTSDGDDVFYGAADLYVGAAINFEFSATDVLDYDYENCEFTFDESFRVWPDGFGTKYVYSEWQILTDVIPSLETLGDTSSADAWRRILAINQETKENAFFKHNITFDGLVSYSESQTTTASNSYTMTTELEVTSGMQEVIGFEVFDVGSKITLSYEATATETDTEGVSQAEARTVAFTLADNDPNDNFTIDILDDGAFGTPVFKLRTGESMCPWEPGTLNREEVGFAIDALTAVNIPANDPAIFQIDLTNQGQTGNDPLIYILGTVEGSNPNGAIISVNGEGLVEPRPFQIQPGETLEMTVTVERGPELYSYQDLGIFMASECQWEHARSLGYDLAGNYLEGDDYSDMQAQYYTPDLDKFYKEFSLDVEFIEPCTPIDIGFPMQDWVVTPDQNNQLFITLDSYIYDDPDLDIVRVQYRPTGGDGSWINIVELPKAEFADAPLFKIVEWDMVELQDGPYDIRAISQCVDVSLAPGISKIIKGRKETRPPELFGTPQPADGVLNPGDEISITFTKRIQCDQIFQADGIGTNINYNNLALIDVATATLIDATIACQDDKIIIVPNVANQFIENRTLRVVTNGIQDLYGNATDEIAWEFYVNRSNLYWDGGQIEEMVEENNMLTVTREIRNQGGAITSFEIPEVPDWMFVFPREGSIAPGGNQVVTFEFPADLLVDTYETTIIMETVDGDEPLPVELRVNCAGPDWSFDASQYTFSMNLTVELDIEGEISEDRVDRVAAFVGSELRGLAYIEYAEDIDRYLAFLTVYSNAAFGETVDFQIWDADLCTLYGTTIESFDFEPDGLIGSPLEPQTIHTNNLILKKIYVNPGWNWISYNLDLEDPAINPALASLTNPENSLIKGQQQFSQYSTNLGIWGGSLQELSHLTMYQYRTEANDSLALIGSPVDPSTPMALTQGWNWIGFLPQQGLPVNEALQSLVPLNGDIIKGQFSFAQYVAGIGWIGNLNAMSSPNGYLIRLSNAGTLIYPDADDIRDEDEVGFRNTLARNYEDERRSPSTYWEMSPENYEFSMNLIGMITNADAEELLAQGDEVAAFVNGELRGSSEVIYIEELDAYLVFLTVYANQEGETLQFKLYDASNTEEIELNESYNFLINAIAGSVDEPVVWTVPGTTTTNTLSLEEQGFTAYPNPASNVVNFRFKAQADEAIQLVISDALGREVDRVSAKALAKDNILEWRPAKDLANGFYFVTLHRANSTQVLKIEILR